MRKHILFFIIFLNSCKFNPLTESEPILEVPLEFVKEINSYFLDVLDNEVLFSKSFPSGSLFVYDIEKDSIIEKYYFPHPTDKDFLIMKNFILVKNSRDIFLYERKLGKLIDSVRFQNSIRIFKINSFEFIILKGSKKLVLYTLSNNKIQPLDSISFNYIRNIKLNENLILLIIGDSCSSLWKVEGNKLENFITKDKKISYILKDYYSEISEKEGEYTVYLKDYMTDRTCFFLDFVLGEIYYFDVKTFSNEIYFGYPDAEQKFRVIVMKAERDFLFYPSPVLSIEIGDTLYDIKINQEYFIAFKEENIKIFRKKL